MAAVVEPRVARPDPANPIWLNVVIQKPDARVHRGLAGAEDGVGTGRPDGRRQVVDGDDPCRRGHIERGTVGRRDRRLQIPCIDDLAAYRDLVKLSGGHVSDLLTGARAAQVLVAGEHADPARLREPRRRLREVFADLSSGRSLVEPGVLAVRLDPILGRAAASSRRNTRKGCADERTDTHPANDLPELRRRSITVTSTSASATNASTKATPLAPAPTTR